MSCFGEWRERGRKMLLCTLPIIKEMLLNRMSLVLPVSIVTTGIKGRVVTSGNSCALGMEGLAEERFTRSTGDPSSSAQGLLTGRSPYLLQTWRLLEVTHKTECHGFSLHSIKCCRLCWEKRVTESPGHLLAVPALTALVHPCNYLSSSLGFSQHLACWCWHLWHPLDMPKLIFLIVF